MTEGPLPVGLTQKLRRASALVPDDVVGTNGHAVEPVVLGRRRAFVCGHVSKDGVRDCNRRVFLTVDEPDRVPDCPEHGRMVVQGNRPYRGVGT